MQNEKIQSPPNLNETYTVIRNAPTCPESAEIPILIERNPNNNSYAQQSNAHANFSRNEQNTNHQINRPNESNVQMRNIPFEPEPNERRHSSRNPNNHSEQISYRNTDTNDNYNRNLDNSNSIIPLGISDNHLNNEMRIRSVYLKRLNNIPEFDGETFENLKKFIEKVETLYCSGNELEKRELFEHVMLKTNGEARNIFYSFDTFDWKAIKPALLKHYAHLCNKNLITTQLENIRQGPKETLPEYSERARKLLRTKNAMYSHLTVEQREEHNRQAYKAYMQGLNNNDLKKMVKTRGATTLDSAIENAIDMELDTTNQVQASELYCRTCRVVGHRERDCRRKSNENNSITSLITALRDVGTLNFNPRTNQPNMQNRAMRYNNAAPPNYYNRGYNYPNQDRLDINPNRNQNVQNDQYYANRYQINNQNMNRPNLNNNIQRSNVQLQQNRPINQIDRNRSEYNPNNAINRRTQPNMPANLRDANNPGN